MSKKLNEGIGHRIGVYRRAQGLTAKQLAERVPDLTENGVAKIEGGHRAVLPVDLILEIAFALQVSPAAILFPLGRPGERIAIGDGEHLVADLYPWMVGPGEDGTEDERVRSGRVFVEMARGVAEDSRSLMEKWGADGEKATTDEDIVRYREERIRARNVVKGLSWIWRQLERGSLFTKKAADGDGRGDGYGFETEVDRDGDD